MEPDQERAALSTLDPQSRQRKSTGSAQDRKERASVSILDPQNAQRKSTSSIQDGKERGALSTLDPRNAQRLSTSSGQEVSRVASSASSIAASRTSQERRSRQATAQTDASLGDWWQEEEDTRSRTFTTTL